MAVVPSHACEVRDGERICGCWKARCEYAGKHPDYTGDATTNRVVMADWIDEGAERGHWVNLMVVTGLQPDGTWLVVIDLDGPDAEARWAELCVGRELPDTFAVITGRPEGGRHLYFLVPELPRTRKPGEGIDVKFHNSVVAAPGSIHAKTGRVYTAVVPDQPIARAPGWLVDLLRAGPAAAAGSDGEPAVSALDGEPAVSPFPRADLNPRTQATLNAPASSFSKRFSRSDGVWAVAVDFFVCGRTYEECEQALLSATGAVGDRHLENPRDLLRCWNAFPAEIATGPDTVDRRTSALMAAAQAAFSGGARNAVRTAEAIAEAARRAKKWTDLDLDQRSLAEATGFGQATVSRHLAALIDAGLLVRRRRRAATHADCYTITCRPVRRADAVALPEGRSLDVWRHGECGEWGRLLHGRLTGEPQSVAALARAAGMAVRTVKRRLHDLRSRGLADLRDSGWVRGDSRPERVWSRRRMLPPGALAEEQRERHRRDRQQRAAAMTAWRAARRTERLRRALDGRRRFIAQDSPSLMDLAFGTGRRGCARRMPGRFRHRAQGSAAAWSLRATGSVPSDAPASRRGPPAASPLRGRTVG